MGKKSCCYEYLRILSAVLVNIFLSNIQKVRLENVYTWCVGSIVNKKVKEL